MAEIENELAMMDAKDLQNSVVAMQGDMKNNSPETYEEKQLLEEAFKELKEASIDANTVIQYSDKENYYKQEVQLIELNEKKERLEKLSKQVNNKTAVAPMDGKIIYISQIKQENIEERFPQKETIGIIANQQEHYLSTDISGIKLRAANEIYTIVNGKKVELEQLTYSNKEKNIANKNGLSLEARFIIPDYEMKIGETYPIFIISNRKENVLAVSVDSLYQENSEYFVYRLEAGEKVKCPVTIGKRTSLEVEIMDGIKKDDLIYYPVENTIATNTPSIRVEEDDYVFTKKLDQTRVTTMYKTPIYCEVENAVIKELLVSTGDVIKKGDTLAYLFVEKGESNILDLYYQQEYLSEVSEFELAQLKEIGRAHV